MDELKLRQRQKRKKPDFVMQGAKNLKRLKNSYRKARGKHSKLRQHWKAHGFIPSSGYGSPKSVRGLHPSGFEDVLVHNIDELKGLDSKKQACRIASTVGKKKRIEIMKKTDELKIKVLNPYKVEKKKEVEKEDKKV